MRYQHLNDLGSGASAQNHQLDANVSPGLGGFCIEYLDHDRNMGLIEVGGLTSDGRGIEDYRSFLLRVNDYDGGITGRETDPVQMSAKYVDLGPRPTLRVVGHDMDTGRALVPIPPLASDELFVLRGFRLTTPADRTHHVREIGLRYVRESSAIEFTFRDDSPSGDRFSFVVYYTIVFHATRTGRHATPHFEGPFEERFGFTEEASVSREAGGAAILAGFNFRFDDNDHHLRKIAIDLELDRRIAVTFTDDERSHSVNCFIEYVVALVQVE